VAPYPPERVLSFSPLTVYEYMAAGLPVVASRFPAIEEPIQDGVTGILCPPGEAAAFAAALLDLADKPSLRHALGLEARRAVLAEHTWARVAERILDLARTTPDAPRGSPPVLARGAATERVLAAFSPLAT
jgi:glycosyltransferase involved in cell wall biosynthesis